MRVTRVLSMVDYDKYTRNELPEKVPDWRSPDFRRPVGDSIYDYSKSSYPDLRLSVHKEVNRPADIRGINVLLSNDFYYFGDKPVGLPASLLPIVHPTQNHKSRANAEYLDRFVAWIRSLGVRPNSLLGHPQLKGEIDEMSSDECRNLCSEQDKDGMLLVPLTPP